MTLIVARAHKGSTYVIGDTALTFSDGRTANPIVQGCLKIYRAARATRAVAFAGVQSHFEQIAPSVLATADVDEAITLAEQAQRQGGDFELLLAEACASDIVFVKNGSVERSAVGFIGSRSAFADFQARIHSPEELEVPGGHARLGFVETPINASDAAAAVYSRMYGSLKAVIANEHIPDVGGLIVALATRHGVFTYMHTVEVVTDALPDTGRAWMKLHFGTAAGGGYAVEVCDDWLEGSGVETGGDHVGFYFLQGGFGVIFPPSQTGVRTGESITAPNPAY